MALGVLNRFQVQFKMSLRDAVKLTHMTFRQVPKMLNPIDVILPVFVVDKLSVVIDPVMLKTAHIQYIVACKIIGIDDAIRVNF